MPVYIRAAKYDNKWDKNPEAFESFLFHLKRTFILNANFDNIYLESKFSYNLAVKKVIF